MRWFVFVAWLGCALAQIAVRLELQDAIDMSRQRFGNALQRADLALAGEPWSQLVRYEDQVLGIRALENLCAGGYYWTGSKCAMCACVSAPSSVAFVNYEPLDYSPPA